jgi:hypothetical protein
MRKNRKFKKIPDPDALIVMFVPAKVGSDIPSVNPAENHVPGTTWYSKTSNVIKQIILIKSR